MSKYMPKYPSAQANLKAEQIEEMLKNFVCVKDPCAVLRRLPLRTQIRYFTNVNGRVQNSPELPAFRTGGYLIDVDHLPNYFRLCQRVDKMNNASGSRWSVQVRYLLRCYIKREDAERYLDEDDIDTSEYKIQDNPEVGAEATGGDGGGGNRGGNGGDRDRNHTDTSSRTTLASSEYENQRLQEQISDLLKEKAEREAALSESHKEIRDLKKMLKEARKLGLVREGLA